VIRSQESGKLRSPKWSKAVLTLPYIWGPVMAEDIDKLFSEYAVRKQEIQTREQQMRDKRIAREQQAYSVFASSVLPPLRDIVANIKAKGHRAELKEAGDDRPSVQFEFLVRESVLSSSLRIDYDQVTDKVCLARVVNKDAGKDHESRETVLISAISEDLIRTTAVDFVRAVLQASVAH